LAGDRSRAKLELGFGVAVVGLLLEASPIRSGICPNWAFTCAAGMPAANINTNHHVWRDPDSATGLV